MIRLAFLNRTLFQPFSVETQQLLGIALAWATITRYNHANAFSTVSTWLEAGWKSWSTKPTETSLFPIEHEKNSTYPSNQKRLIPIEHHDTRSGARERSGERRAHTQNVAVCSFFLVWTKNRHFENFCILFIFMISWALLKFNTCNCLRVKLREKTHKTWG